MHAIHITDYAQKIGHSMSFGDIVEIYQDIRNKFHLEDRKNYVSGKEDVVTDKYPGVFAYRKQCD